MHIPAGALDFIRQVSLPLRERQQQPIFAVVTLVFFLTHGIDESHYHVIKQIGGLVFFELKTDDQGGKHL